MLCPDRAYGGSRGLAARSLGIMTKNWLKDESGAATAEYAIATLAAVGFAGLLVVILRSEEVRGMLTELVRGALQLPG
jgi:Flp pilus assembly pilin Flp